MLLWFTILAGPIAWALSLSVMFWLTRDACVEGALGPILTVGVICALITVVAGIRAAVALVQPLGQMQLTRFMLGLAVAASAMFVLVIVLSIVPISMLTPCPL
jgi:small basic protein